MLRKKNNINKTLSCFFVTEDPKISFVVVKKVTFSHWKKVNKKNCFVLKLYQFNFFMFCFECFIFLSLYFISYCESATKVCEKTQFHRFPLSVKVLFLLGFFTLWSSVFCKNLGGKQNYFKSCVLFFVMHNISVCPDVSTLIYYLFFFLLFHRKGT